MQRRHILELYRSIMLRGAREAFHGLRRHLSACQKGRITAALWLQARYRSRQARQLATMHAAAAGLQSLWRGKTARTYALAAKRVHGRQARLVKLSLSRLHRRHESRCLHAWMRFVATRRDIARRCRSALDRSLLGRLVHWKSEASIARAAKTCAAVGLQTMFRR